MIKGSTWIFFDDDSDSSTKLLIINFTHPCQEERKGREEKEREEKRRAEKRREEQSDKSTKKEMRRQTKQKSTLLDDRLITQEIRMNLEDESVKRGLIIPPRYSLRSPIRRAEGVESDDSVAAIGLMSMEEQLKEGFRHVTIKEKTRFRLRQMLLARMRNKQQGH